MMNALIKLTVSGLVYNKNIAGTYGLILTNEDRTRRFSIMIGEPEAQSIALQLHDKVPPRPLTHDLLLNILLAMDAEVIKALIYDMSNDIFFSELHIQQGGKIFIIDSRTSDAIAIAVRSQCPIYIHADIFNCVSTVISTEINNHDGIQSADYIGQDYINLSSAELEILLKTALENEKYEEAAKIRDALNQKKTH
ncbi:MAG: bifunctional nuclease family protein [Prevotellaceae bacterium]|jgi:bifunctional DNase/RNase|nr:bifunctional nuclease family protein [Prevotellaceae bacterium]